MKRGYQSADIFFFYILSSSDFSLHVIVIVITDSEMFAGVLTEIFKPTQPDLLPFYLYSHLSIYASIQMQVQI